MSKTNYDAIIIGAGISGLVCAAYLAKAGMKVLVVEKNYQAGGYCTSFKRGEFTFDACAHSLGSLRPGGIIDNVLKDLDLRDKINIVQHNPSDIIIGPDFKINLWNNIDQLIDEFSAHFLDEKDNIVRFFNFVDTCRGLIFNSLRQKTFSQFLDEFFTDQKLKAFIALPVLGNAGLGPSKISAFTAVNLYKEFMIDGGYYPEKGMQEYANIFVDKIRELGSDVFLSTKVKNISLKEGFADGVVLSDDRFVTARYVISNADFRHTFLELIGKNYLSEEFIHKTINMVPALSAFMLYLGLSSDLSIGSSAMWYLPHYDVDKMYASAIAEDMDDLEWYLFKVTEGKNALAIVNAPFKDREYWNNNREHLMEKFIERIENIVPGFSQHVIYKESATPYTLYKWTMNHAGSSYGWEDSLSQLAVFSQTTQFDNLYLTGHWTTLAQGIPGVTYLGRSTAKLICNKERGRK